MASAYGKLYRLTKKHVLCAVFLCLILMVSGRIFNMLTSGLSNHLERDNPRNGHDLKETFQQRTGDTRSIDNHQRSTVESNLQMSFEQSPFSLFANNSTGAKVTSKKKQNVEEMNEPVNEILIDQLTSLLRSKLYQLPSSQTGERTLTCNKTTIGNSCEQNGCLRQQLPNNLHSRIAQIVEAPNLHLSLRMKKTLLHMGNQVPGYFDIIFVSASSWSHYEESLALIHNLHKNIFPHLKNFTFILYDLGLNKTQREFISSVCQCQVIDFPFHYFPRFVSYIKCYTWKPIILNAHISKANLVFWVDSSIRFYEDPKKTLEILKTARTRGIQAGQAKNSVSKATLTSMFHFFGDEACAYSSYKNCLFSSAVFHNELLVKRAVLEPLAACAINGLCMCPQTGVSLTQIRISCHVETRFDYEYGICHRFDQSALTILISKLFQEKVDSIFLPNFRDVVKTSRGDRMEESMFVKMANV